MSTSEAATPQESHIAKALQAAAEAAQDVLLEHGVPISALMLMLFSQQKTAIAMGGTPLGELAMVAEAPGAIARWCTDWKADQVPR